MWSSILLRAGVVLCLSFSRTHFTWSNIAIATSVFLPWYGLASGVLLIRYYRGLLTRVSYLLLLIYWFVWVSGGGAMQFSRHLQYSYIFSELLRSRHAKGGETDPLGRHWTINIAEFIINTALDELLNYFFPDWFWTRSVFVAVLNLVVFGHCVFQLFLQQQITRIVRLNRVTFRWRDHGIECFWYTVTHHLNNRATRNLVYAWWWTCHQVYQNLTPEVMDKLPTNLLSLSLIYSVFYGYTATHVVRARN
jgi:hypothetical protein